MNKPSTNHFRKPEFVFITFLLLLLSKILLLDETLRPKRSRLIRYSARRVPTMKKGFI
jgi:hypothetical protein